jgi:hypothetical protein
MVRIIPRETKFFDMFADMSGNLTEGARLLTELLTDFQQVDGRVQALKGIEHRGDEMTHSILVKLNQIIRLSIVRTFTGWPAAWMTSWT